ncbi:MAG TPA: hypothetical protein VGA08_00845 [Candidatus Saccharimonadales bacterium]
MKVYIAARTKRADDACYLADKLEQEKHSVTFKWFDEVITNRIQNKGAHRDYYQFVRKALLSASNAEIFILLSDSGMRGTYVEMGAFLLSQLQNPKSNPKLIIVGGEKHSHIFESVSFTYHVDSVDQVIDLVEIN